VLPEVIDLAPFDVNEYEESKSGKVYLTVKYERLVPLIIETIKEHQQEIEELNKVLLNGR
jgi:hypothetical protein